MHLHLIIVEPATQWDDGHTMKLKAQSLQQACRKFTENALSRKMSEPWIKRIRSIIAMVWVMLTWNWTWVIFPSDWHKMICTADSEWVTIHSSMHQPTVNSELCLPKDCTCKGCQNISEWTANLSYITVFTSLLCVFTYTMCRNMSVDAYQAAVALIAKDTLSLSNRKMIWLPAPADSSD